MVKRVRWNVDGVLEIGDGRGGGATEMDLRTSCIDNFTDGCQLLQNVTDTPEIVATHGLLMTEVGGGNAGVGGGGGGGEENYRVYSTTATEDSYCRISTFFSSNLQGLSQEDGVDSSHGVL